MPYLAFAKQRHRLLEVPQELAHVLIVSWHYSLLNFAALLEHIGSLLLLGLLLCCKIFWGSSTPARRYQRQSENQHSRARILKIFVKYTFRSC